MSSIYRKSSKDQEWSIKFDWSKVFFYMKKLSYILPGLVISIFLIFVLYKNMTAPYVIDFCYLSRHNDLTILKGHINWHSDEEIEFFGTTQKAAEAAKAINCPLNITKIQPNPGAIEIEK